MASGILPDVEGGILPPGKNAEIIPYCQNPFTRLNVRAVPSAGLEARLHGRPGGPPPLQPVFPPPDSGSELSLRIESHSGLTKTVAAPENRLDDSVRFWTAAALCRFFTGRRATQSGRGLPQSTTLTRNSFARNRLGGHRILKPI